MISLRGLECLAAIVDQGSLTKAVALVTRFVSDLKKRGLPGPS
jgi:hypothetical protein